VKINEQAQLAGGKEVVRVISGQAAAKSAKRAVTPGAPALANAVDKFFDGTESAENLPHVGVQNAPKPGIAGLARVASPFIPGIDTTIDLALNATCLLHSYLWPQEFAVIELAATLAAAFFAARKTDSPAASLRGIWAAVRSGHWYAPQAVAGTFGLEKVSSAASAANYHQAVGSICAVVNHWVVADAAGVIKPAELRPLYVIRNIIADFQAMPVPRDEITTEECNILCARLMRATLSLNEIRKFIVYTKVGEIIGRDRNLSSLAAYPIARFYLAQIYIDNKDMALRHNALAYLRANHALEVFRFRSTGRNIKEEDISPWWDATRCPSPAPDPQMLEADKVCSDRVRVVTFRRSQNGHLELSNDSFPEKKLLATHLTYQRVRFLTMHAEVFAVAQALAQWMEVDPYCNKSASLVDRSVPAQFKALPHIGLATLTALRDKLATLRAADFPWPTLEDGCNWLTYLLQRMDRDSKASCDITAQLVFLLRNDVELERINMALAELRGQIDCLYQAFRSSEGAANRQRILAELIAAEDAEKQDALVKQSASKPKPKLRTRISTPRKPAATTHAAGHVPDSPPNKSRHAEPSATAVSDDDREFRPVKSRKTSIDEPWRLALQQYAQTPSAKTPTEMHEVFERMMQESLGDAAVYHLEGYEFYTRLPPAVLRAMLPLFVDPGSHASLAKDGYSRVSCIAASLDFHFKKHVLLKAAAWPLGEKTPIEDLVAVGIKLNAEQDQAITRSRVDDPGRVVKVKRSHHYFGIYSEDNLVLSCGPRGATG
jgi:hypothetical protein